MKTWRNIVIVLVLAVGVGILRVPILSAVTAVVNETVRIVDSTGTVINGTASAVSAKYNKTVQVVDSTGHVIDSFGGGAPSGAAGGALSGTYPNPGINPAPGITSRGTNTGSNVLTNGYALNLQFLAATQGGIVMWGEPYVLTVAGLNPAGSTPDPIVLDAADAGCTAAAPAVGGGTAECIVHWTGAAWVYVTLPDGPITITDHISNGGESLQITGFWNDGGNVQYNSTSAAAPYNVGNSVLKLNHADLQVSGGGTLGTDTIVNAAGSGAPNFSNGLQIAGSNKGTPFASGTVAATDSATVGCTDTTATVANVTTAMSVVVSPVGAPSGTGGGNVTWTGYPTAGHVTVRVCTIVVVTAAATTYNYVVLN